MGWLRQLFSRRRRYDELSESICEHLDEKVADLMDRGVTREEAERTARLDFGNVARIEERSREVWQSSILETAIRDLRFALRRLLKSPGFTLTATLTLALGIGATTAIFTLVHAVLLESLPVKDPGQLWRVGDNEQCCVDGGLPDYNHKPGDWSLFSYEQYREFRDHTLGLESLAAFEASATDQMAVRRADSSHPVEPYYGEFVSGNSFHTLGLRAYAGRLLRSSDDVQGAAPVAVISFRAWEQKLGHDPAVVGSTLQVNGEPVTVVGIAPPGFYGERLSPTPPELWLPLNLMRLIEPQHNLLVHPELQWLNLIGRVAPGADIGAIQARMQVELQQFLRSPLSRIASSEQRLIPRQYLRLTPGGGGVQRMQDKYKADLDLLMWISAFVLLIACANLANLMLARSTGQRQQASVQTALGASRRRLVQRALSECLMLAMFGGAAGLLTAWAAVKMILHLAFEHNPISVTARPSPVVLLFTFAVSLLTGFLFGVAPAWMASHANPIDALRGANRATSRHLWSHKALVIAQVAISTVLLSAAGFLILSLTRLHHENFGFVTHDRYVLQISPQTAGYQPDQLGLFYRNLHDTLAAIPGVSDIAYSLYTPMSGDNWGEWVFIEGETAPPSGANLEIDWNRVSPDYFRVLGTKLLQGRAFLKSDDRNSQNVAIVNQAFVNVLLHGKNPIGVHFGNVSPNVTNTFDIVGVVQNSQYGTPGEPIHPMYFLPSAQWTTLPASNPGAANYAEAVARSHYMGSVVIETHGSVPDLESDVRTALAGISPNLIIISFRSFADQVNLAFTQQNMITKLTSLFGLLALALAAIGLYGVTAYAVAERTSEIGVRMALGANRLQIQQIILRSALLQLAIGLLIGVPVTLFVGRYLSAELYHVASYNPLVLGAVISLLLMTATLAALIPARRAAATDPMQALRSE